MTPPHHPLLLAYLGGSSLLLILLWLWSCRARPAAGLKLAVGIYLLLTALALNSSLALWLVYSPAELDLLFRVGPMSDQIITLMCVGLAWALAGLLLGLWWRGRLHASNAVFWAGFLATGFVYLNIVRERFAYGDVGDYIQAAINLSRGKPLPGRYLYPPLWATLLQGLVPLGQNAIFLACLGANLLALLLLYVLLVKSLVRYGCASSVASFLVCVGLLLNVPLLRTLFYVQVNLHVVNLILLCLLLYPARPWLSAVALATAVHLKVSPIILVLPFVLRRDWRWSLAFLATLLGITTLTSLANGFAAYGQFLTNVTHAYLANGIVFRDNSLDSFLRATFWVLGQPPGDATWLIGLLKLLLLLGSLGIVRLAVCRRSFCVDRPPGESLVDNAYPILLFPMTMLSPLVWEHHFVFVLLPFFLMLRKSSTPGDFVLLFSASFLIFLLPTFDAYPWSYNRLLGILLGYVLLYRLAGREGAPASPVFASFAALFRPLDASPAKPGSAAASPP